MRFHRTIMTPASHCKSRKRAAAVAARVAQVAALELAVVAPAAVAALELAVVAPAAVAAAELRQVLAALAVVVPQPARGALAVNAWAAAVADAKACAARPAADAAAPMSTFGSASEIAATVVGMATALSFMAAAVALSS
jgi:hypothetical protein